MPIFYRTPNCTFVNVGQFKPKFYRKHFQIGLLDNIYAQIARAEFHLKGRIRTCQFITTDDTLKAQLNTKWETL